MKKIPNALVISLALAASSIAVADDRPEAPTGLKVQLVPAAEPAPVVGHGTAAEAVPLTPATDNQTEILVAGGALALLAAVTVYAIKKKKGN